MAETLSPTFVGMTFGQVYIYTLDILFSSNHNDHRSSGGLCFWASDPLIEEDY